jgi:hypothetical protein
MADAYSEVKESELIEGVHERDNTIVEHERQYVWRETYCRHLHVAGAVVEDEAQGTWDEGLGGRIKALRRELKADVADLMAGQAKLETKMDARQAKVEAEMADTKVLLEKLVAQSLQRMA